MYVVSHFGGDLMGLWRRGLKKSEIVIFWAFFNFFAPWCAISHKDYWDWLYFHEKVLKKCSTCSKIPRISPPPWFNVVPSLEKLCQAVVTRNEKAKWQPTLNKGPGDASLIISVTDCAYLIELKLFHHLNSHIQQTSP